MAGPSGNESNHTLDGLTVRGGLALEGPAGTYTYLNRDAGSNTARQQALLRGRGIYAQTFDMTAQASATITSTQEMHGMAIGLLAGDVVSNLSVAIHAAGASVTMCKLGLYTKAQALVASSAESGASFATTGMKTLAMTTPYVVPTDDLYYVAYLAVSAVTMPTPLRGLGNVIAACAGPVGNGVAVQVKQTAQSDLPATATMITTTSGLFIWVGVS